MIINNIKVYTEDKLFKEGSIHIKDGMFVQHYKKSQSDEYVIDGKGTYAIPGLIDMHLHGCNGYDFCDGTKKAIEEIAKYELHCGITAMAPATMTLPVPQLEQILTVAAEYQNEITETCSQGADLVGINMEGSFISPMKNGAQDTAHILPCQVDLCERFVSVSGGLVKYIGIAPEVNENYTDFIDQMKDKINISLAHTNADYDTAKAAFDAGAVHVVHLHNAMPEFRNREPGVIGAVSDNDNVTVELICDGVHVHPSMVRATFKMLGDERIVLISDSMRATGISDGIYTLGGQMVRVEGNCATLVKDGTLAGSVTNLMDSMRIAVKKMGIKLETAIACATENPAKCLGIYKQYGSISVGKKANVVLLDSELQLQMVIKDGNVVIDKFS